METIFKVKDRVYEGVKYQSWGNIIDIDSTNNYPISVEFDKGNIETYTLDGRFKHEERPTLSFTEYNLTEGGFSQERPEILPEKGDIVWVRDVEYRSWVITHFLKKDKDKPSQPFKCSARNKEDVSSYWRFMTTENPYLSK